MTKIYLVRHCNSMTNNKRILAGWLDTDISETGAKQLELLAERFRDIKLDKVYASPLQRARKTGLAVNKYPAAPFEICDDFKEIYIGEFEGKTIEEMSPEQFAAWTGDISKFRSEKGEIPEDALERFKRGFFKAVRENEGKTIAIASHGSVLRMFCCYMKGLGLDKYYDIYGMKNTAVVEVNYSKENGFEFITENDVSHLESYPDLITSGWKVNAKQ